MPKLEVTDLQTVEQAAERLKIKPTTVRSWANKRRFTFVRLNRTIRIPRSEIDRLIETSVVPALER